MARRTKAQISQDNYIAEVDKYNYFLLDTSINKIIVGFEFKEDAQQEQQDNDSKHSTQVLSKRQCKSKGININEVLNTWKQL